MICRNHKCAVEFTQTHPNQKYCSKPCCRRQNSLDAYYRDLDSRRIRARLQYHNNREIIKKRIKEYRSKNKGKYTALGRAYRARMGRQTLNNVHEIWRINNPVKAQNQAIRRKYRISSVTFDLTDSQWSDLKAAYDYVCAYCGSPGKLTQDHVVPIKKGGGHTYSNVVPACTRCNCSKKDSDLGQFLSSLIDRRVIITLPDLPTVVR